MIDRINKRWILITVAFVMAFAGCAGMTVSASNSEYMKKENVYVISDANGKINKTIVGVNIKNYGGLKKIKDVSDLSDIESIKEGVKIKSKKGEHINWSTGGEDVSYRGKSTKRSPVSVKVKYYINDKERSSQEMKNAKGKFKIKIWHINSTKSPLAMLTAIAFENDQFRDVQINQGKVIASGRKFITAGVTVQGAAKNKGSQDLLAGPLEISGETTGFKMGGSITIADNELFSKIGNGKKIPLDELNGKMGELNAGLDKLKSGGGSLNDGLSKFAKAYFKIKDAGERINGGYFLIRLGMQGLTLGGQGLNKASGSLDENFDKIGKGLAKLEKGFADVKDNKSAAEVMKAIIEGEGKLVAALTQLEQVTQKAKQLDQQLHATIENTRIGLKAGLEAGGNAVYQNEKISGKYKVDELMDKLKQKADKLSANIDAAEKSRKKLLESLVKKTNFTKDGAKAGAKAIAGVGTMRAKHGAIEGKFKGLVDETDVLAALSGELGKINSGTQIGGYTDLSANIRAAIDVNKNLQNILEKLRGKSENPLAKVIEGALSNAKNRLFNKLSLKNNYDNFSGKEKNVESSVRFYIRTEDIGA